MGNALINLASSKIGYLTDVFPCNLHQYLYCNRTRQGQGLDRTSRAGRTERLAVSRTGPKPAWQGSQMDTIAPIRPTVLRERRISLIAGPAAAGTARRQVRSAIYAWNVPTDPATAVLLTSELVTNAIRHEVSGTVKLIITCACGRFRVDVHDTSRSVPVPVDEPADAETGRGLMLVASLSADWGYYWTPAGKAVYFVLAFEDDLDEGGGDHH